MIAFAIASLVAGVAHSQEPYPARPVRFIVPFPPSGPIDIVARLYAQKLGERWKRAVVVENRSGATGTVGTDAAVKAAPDGYTLLFTVDLPIVMAPALFKIPYNPVSDLLPIAAIADSMNVLAAHPSAGVNTLTELVAAGKAKPGSLTYASAGNASPGHLCGEILAAATGANFTHVPYKGAAPASTAVLAGEVSMFCGPLPLLLPQVRSGKVRAIGVTGAEKSALAPDIPTLAASYPSVVLTSWYALFAPQKTPPAVTSFLRTELRTVFDDNDIKARLVSMGVDSRWIDSADLAKLVDVDGQRWSRIIKTANIKAD